MKRAIFIGFLATLVLPSGVASATQVPAASQSTAPTASDRAFKLEALFDALKNAEVPASARQIADEIWKMWMTAPNTDAQKLLDSAMKKRSVYDFAGALKDIDRLIEVAPDYSEGWNQRATLLFLQEKYEKSLDAIEKTLELEPRHFGSLAGQARILMRTGRMTLGQSVLRKAIDIFPYIPERSMLIEPPKNIPETKDNKS